MARSDQIIDNFGTLQVKHDVQRIARSQHKRPFLPALESRTQAVPHGKWEFWSEMPPGIRWVMPWTRLVLEARNLAATLPRGTVTKGKSGWNERARLVWLAVFSMLFTPKRPRVGWMSIKMIATRVRWQPPRTHRTSGKMIIESCWTMYDLT